MTRLCPTRLRRLKTWMQGYVDNGRFPGASTLIRAGGKEVFFHATGQRDVEQGLPWERDTVARIYSMTKPITSLAVMMLVERGLFHLEAPLSDFLPEFTTCHALRPDARAISDTIPCAPPTIHQLLTHTAGFSYPFNPGLLAREMDARDLMFKPSDAGLADQVRALAELPLAFQPGERWEYSVSIDVLGRVIEVVSGKQLDQFLDQEIFQPLGMTDTAFSVPAHATDRFAALYTPFADDPFAVTAGRAEAGSLHQIDGAQRSAFLNARTFSGGGLVGSIDDYMAFAEMLRMGGRSASGHLVSPRTLVFMMQNHLPGDIADMGPTSFAEQPMEGMGFGLGGAVVRNPARARCPGSVGDFGWGGMASTFFWVDPVLDLSVVFFTQLSPSSSYPARPELKALVHGAVLD